MLLTACRKMVASLTYATLLCHRDKYSNHLTCEAVRADLDPNGA